MRKSIFFILILFFNVQYSISQDTQSNVYTPKGSTVAAWIMQEQTSDWRNYYDQYYSNAYPQNTMIIVYDNKSSTRRFNCHGYAWYMTESGLLFNNPRWIGYSLPTEEDIYMSDGSYVQVASEMYPGKVSWGSADHSAVTTSNPGIYISKWNEYPLFQHAWNNTPYGTSNLKYYVSTAISGTFTPLCNLSSRVYSVVSIPGATYNWSVGSGLSTVPNGNSVTVTANSSYKGSSYVEVTITSPLGGGQNDIKTSKRMQFWIGTPLLSITGPSTGCVNTYDYAASPTGPFSGAYNYTWSITPVTGTYLSPYGADHEYCAVTFNVASGYRLMVKAQNVCGTGTNAYKIININPCLNFSLYPNPADETVTLTKTINESSDVNAFEVQEDFGIIYTLRIIDHMGVLYYTGKFSGNTYTLPLTNLNDGSYIIQIINGKDVYNKQLIIKH